MKKLSKGLFYYKPSSKKRYIEQGLDESKIDDYINDENVMIWHECEEWSRRPGKNRVSLIHTETVDNVSQYACPHCSFTYDLDNDLTLIKSA